MCLDKILKKEFIVKNDIPVWKVCKINIYNDKVIGIYNFLQEVKIKRGLIVDPNYKFNETKVLQTNSENSYNLSFYPIGFHCFSTKKTAEIYKSNYNSFINNEELIIIKFYIPITTKITIGLQKIYNKNFKTYVTPILLKK